MKNKHILLSAFMLCISVSGFAQMYNPVTWALNIEKVDKNKFYLHLNATIEEGWKFYAMNPPVIEVNNLQFNYELTGVSRNDSTQFLTPTIKTYDSLYQWELNAYHNKADFMQLFKIEKSNAEIKLEIVHQNCKNEICSLTKKHYLILITKGEFTIKALD